MTAAVPMGTHVATLLHLRLPRLRLALNSQRFRTQGSPPRQARTEEESAGASDGLLINGSTNNGASSPFAQFPAFGNDRSGRRGLYNGGLGIIGDAFRARCPLILFDWSRHSQTLL